MLWHFLKCFFQWGFADQRSNKSHVKSLETTPPAYCSVEVWYLLLFPKTPTACNFTKIHIPQQALGQDVLRYFSEIYYQEVPCYWLWELKNNEYLPNHKVNSISRMSYLISFLKTKCSSIINTPVIFLAIHYKDNLESILRMFTDISRPPVWSRQ